MKILRALSSCLLVLTLVVSSVTMATARHQPRAVGEMVLCTGRGMVTVDVDAQGRPTGPILPCPDCVIVLNALPGGQTTLPAPTSRLIATIHTLRDHATPTLRARLLHRSRAPPVAV